MSRGFLSCQFTVRSTDRRPRLDPTAGVRPRRCEGSAPGRAGDKGRVRTSRQRMSRCGALPALVAVTVVSCAAQDQVPRLRTAAHRDRNDVVHLEEEARAAAPPAIPVDEGAAPLIAPPDLSFSPQPESICPTICGTSPPKSASPILRPPCSDPESNRRLPRAASAPK